VPQGFFSPGPPTHQREQVTCQKKKLSSVPGAMPRKVSRRQRKQVNSSAKKSSTCAKVSTARVLPSRPLPLGCQRPAAPESSCLRPRKAAPRPRFAGRPSAICAKDAVGANLRRRAGRGQPRMRCAGSQPTPHRVLRFPGRRDPAPTAAAQRRAIVRGKPQPARAGVATAIAKVAYTAHPVAFAPQGDYPRLPDLITGMH